MRINVTSQPLHYDDLIKFIRKSGKKYKAIIDVDLYSTIQLIWDLHENLLDSIHRGNPPNETHLEFCFTITPPFCI